MEVTQKRRSNSAAGSVQQFSSPHRESDEDSNYVSNRDYDSVQIDSDDEEYQPTIASTAHKAHYKSLSTSKRKVGQSIRKSSSSSASVQRMPTRRPNPNVFNRNAIMARENRKKKKELLETLEKNVDWLKDENYKLKKALKKRDAMVRKLEQDRLYLRSVIANETGIMSLIKTIQSNHKMPVTSSVLSFVTADDHNTTANVKNLKNTTTLLSCRSPASTTNSDVGGHCSSNDDDEKENGTILHGDPFLSASLIDNQFLFTDLENFTNYFNDDTFISNSVVPLENWENLLSDNNCGLKLPCLSDEDDNDDEERKEADDEPLQKTLSNVSNEHNYFNDNLNEQKQQQSTITDDVTQTPGICLHISNNRISMEFCLSCHRNSQNAWFEEL